MTITRVNPSAWSDGETITHTQANALDVNATYAVDGNAGGTYSPSADIEIGGANDLKLLTTKRLKYASRSLTIVQPLCGDHGGTNVNWASDSTSGTIYNHTANDGTAIYLTKIPDQSVLTRVDVYYEGAAGHALDPVDGGGGISMPYLEIYYRTVSTSTPTIIGARATDTDNVRAVYQANHDWYVGGLSHTVDLRNNQYFALFASEAGADWIAAGTITAVTCTCTVTEQTEF